MDAVATVIAVLGLIIGVGIGIGRMTALEASRYTAVVCAKPDITQSDWGDTWVGCVLSQVPPLAPTSE